MRDFSKREKIMLMIVLSAVILILGVGTYSYFTSSIDDDEIMGATLNTATMALTFEDNDASISATLDINESIIKKFKITNTGTIDGSLSLEWYQLVNTYTNGSLTYTLSWCDTEDGTYKNIDGATNVNVPVSESPLNAVIFDELTVPANATRNRVRYYNLEIKLNHLSGVDQSDDIDAHLNTLFRVDASSGQKYILTINPNGGIWNGSSSLGSISINKGSSVQIEYPTKEEFIFAGWYDALENGTLITRSTTYTPTSNQTLYARWVDSGENEIMVEFAGSCSYGRPTLTGNPVRGEGTTTFNFIDYSCACGTNWSEYSCTNGRTISRSGNSIIVYDNGNTGSAFCSIPIENTRGSLDGCDNDG